MRGARGVHVALSALMLTVALTRTASAQGSDHRPDHPRTGMEFFAELKDSWALQAPFDVGEGGRIGCVVVEAPLPDTRRTSSSVAI